jgi:hypothetical protein
MAADQSHQRSVKAARWFAVAYVLASLVAFLIGRPLVHQLWSESEPYLLLGYFLLGPLSTLAHSIWGPSSPLGGGDWFFHSPILTTYVIETFLLAGTVALWILQWRIVRWTGYISSALLWLGSGFLTLMATAYGA